MKKYIWAILGIYVLGVSGYAAEIIESLSFNPSRLGRYETLKVSDKLVSKGGINAQALTIQSMGTVTIDNDGDYQILEADVQGAVDMPETLFEGGTVYSSGTAAFVDRTSGAYSNIRQIDTQADLLRLRANVLRVGTMSIEGGEAQDYDDAAVSGFTLGNNKIPKPSRTCSGLSWITRTAEQNGKKYNYQVLGYTNCLGGAGECNTDARTYWDASAKKCACPGADEYYHMGSCCSASTPYSDTK